MGDVHYMISEAAKHVGVESHVLRYWEEELDLPIGRTEMGHRHYTEEDIQLFSCIKELKEQGLPEGDQTAPSGHASHKSTSEGQKIGRTKGCRFDKRSC